MQKGLINGNCCLLTNKFQGIYWYDFYWNSKRSSSFESINYRQTNIHLNTGWFTNHQVCSTLFFYSKLNFWNFKIYFMIIFFSSWDFFLLLIRSVIIGRYKRLYLPCFSLNYVMDNRGWKSLVTLYTFVTGLQIQHQYIIII